MEQYLIYLRKSRKDQDLELRTGTFDTLQRHRDALLSLAQQRGYSIAHIFEEVVSGDTIAERPQMQQLLAAVETCAFAGVLVMEIPRLARGNTRDQGIVAETFQYSGTKIITPDKIFDPADDADAEYFEFGLFMSRREYKAINRRLQRGRFASLEEGKYIAGSAPYGYRRVRIPQQKGYTLEPDPGQAATVREVFSLYIYGTPMSDGSTSPIGTTAIAALLNARGILSPGGRSWTAGTVRSILKNPVYAGRLRWAHRPDRKQMKNGTVVTSRPVNSNAFLQDGLHPPLVSLSDWNDAQSLLARRSHPSVPGKRETVNPLSGLLRCSLCGRTLVQLSHSGHGAPTLLCPTPHCPTVSSRRDIVERSLLETLDVWLGAPIPFSPRSSPTPASTDPVLPLAKQRIDQLRTELRSLEQRQEQVFDFLEQGVYSPDDFQRRSKALSLRRSETSAQLETLLQYAESRENRSVISPDFSQPLKISQLYARLRTPGEQNVMLKALLDHVIYAKSQGGKWKQGDLCLYLYPKQPASLFYL